MFDKVIKNVRIIDGSAAPWYRGDIGIQDGRIRKIGCIAQEENTVDGGDLYAAPGFIDIHSHSDTTLMEYSKAESRPRSEETAVCQPRRSAMILQKKKCSALMSEI